MAEKTPVTGRKSAKKKTIANQTSTVTPIDQRSAVSSGNGAAFSHSSGNAQSSPIGPEIQEQIKARAYELYEQRGRQHGLHQEDWKRAEAEVLARYRRDKSA